MTPSEICDRIFELVDQNHDGESTGQFGGFQESDYKKKADNKRVSSALIVETAGKQ